MIRHGIHILLCALFVFVALQCTDQQDKLLSLNKRVAEDPSIPTDAVMHQVFTAYSQLDIADSLQQAVQDSVAVMIERPLTFPDLPVRTEKDLYTSEFNMQKRCRDLLVLRARGDETRFAIELSRGLDISHALSRELGNDYWEERLASLKSFSTADALAWLSAYVAEQQCASRYADINTFEEAEQLAALALRNLQHIPDDRLRLDICQRLAVILYKFRPYFHLAFSMLQECTLQAKIKHYYLREVGSRYNFANAQVLAGKYEEALMNLLRAIEVSEFYSNVPAMDYYTRKLTISRQLVFIEMGQYSSALKMSDDIKLHTFDVDDKVDIMLNNGLALQWLGYFELAVQEFIKAIELTEIENEYERMIVAYKDLAYLYYLFLDFEKAKLYAEQALKLSEGHYSEPNDLYCSVLLTLANIYFIQGEKAQLQNVIAQLEDQIENIRIPFIQSSWHRFLGKFYTSIGDFNKGEYHLKRALLMHSQHQSTRASFVTRLDIVKTYLQQGRYDIAKQMANELKTDCEQSNHILLLIEAQANIADIAYHQHNIGKARELNSEIVDNIQYYAERISNPDYLLLYNQRIYSFLKRAADIDAEFGDLQSALSKLDFSKALCIGSFTQKWESTPKPLELPKLDLSAVQAKLKPDELILNYMVSENKLRVYVISADTVQFEDKSLDLLYFKKLLFEYVDMIIKTIQVLNTNDISDWHSHHSDLTKLSTKISSTLFEWKMFAQFSNYHTFYILPDDILYEVPFSSLVDHKNPNQYTIQSRQINLIQSLMHFETYHKDERKSPQKMRILLSLDPSFPSSHKLKDFLNKNFTNVDVLRSESIPKMDDVISQFNKHYDLYLIVGHSSANFTSPNDSKINCTVFGNDNKTYKLDIALQNIKKIKWPSDSYIFLIGCETARGKLYQGTGLASLQRYISLLGGTHIVSSMWEVDAAFTINQTISILQHVLEGKTLGEAMQFSQLEQMDFLMNDPYYQVSHPYLWASLSLLQ